MINNLKQQSRKDDILLVVKIVIVFLIIAWFCTPPGNKFWQLCFYGNNVKFFITKLIDKDSATEYIFYRNQAVYLAKMYPKNKDTALAMMERAIGAISSAAPEREIKLLHKDLAEMKLYFGDRKGALRDYILARDVMSYEDVLKVAMLFKEEGNYREAVRYCNLLFELNQRSYTGYACRAELYNSLGRADIALKQWDSALKTNSKNAYVYIERAKVKKNLGDFLGAEADIKMAKELLPSIDTDFSVADDAIAPKELKLEIRRI